MTDQFDGDLALILTRDGGEIIYTGGQPQMDAGGLETSVLISLFTGAGWWGNALEFNSPDNQIGSIFEQTVQPHSITLQRLILIENEAKNALQWMINLGIAKSVSVSVISPQLNQIEITITIIKPDSESIDFRYELNWQNGVLFPVCAKFDSNNAIL